MDQYDEDLYMESEEDEIDIMEYVRKALKEWKLILRWCCYAAVIGLVVAFSLKHSFTTTATLAPETSSKSSGGNLSSLAAMAGINLGSTSADAMSPDFYPDVVSSTPFVVELFPTPVEFTYKKEKMTTDLYTYFKDYSKKPWWNAVLHAPMQGIGWVLGLLHGKKDKQDVVEGYSNINPSELTPEQAGIVGEVRKNVSVSVDKKTGAISLSATAQDAHVSYQLCEAVRLKLMEYVTNYRTDKARKDLEYYEQIFKESQENYYAAQQRYARYTDANQGIVLERVRTESERLQNEMNLAYSLYNSCAQQLQVAKFDVQKETPVCTILEPATVPLRSTTSKPKTLIIFIFLGAIAAIVWVVFLKDWIASLKAEPAEEEQPSAPAES